MGAVSVTVSCSVAIVDCIKAVGESATELGVGRDARIDDEDRCTVTTVGRAETIVEGKICLIDTVLPPAVRDAGLGTIR